VTTPLLDRPLSGPIYLRTSNHELPDLALDLNGQFSITALGRVDSVHARLRTVFETIPDVPVSRIDVMLMGGRKGLVINSKSLCDRPRFATVKMTGQNGASLMSKSRLRANCRKAERRKRSSRRGGGK
jgi:hypothetical protein